MTLPIDGPRLTLSPGTAASVPVSSWAVGQLLQAVVEGRSPGGTVTLRLGGLLLEGRSDLPLRPGQTLTLQVTRTGASTVLRIVPETTVETVAINQALRQALPRQGDIRPLLDTLTSLARSPGSLPPALVTLADRLLSRLPDIRALAVPGDLKQALRDSGLFLEARLARGDSPERDFKAMSLQLQAALREARATVRHGASGPAPSAPDDADSQIPALQQRTDAALARVVVNQIDSLPREPGATTPLVVELPLRWHDRPAMLRLRIEPDDTARRDDGGARGGSAWLSFEPGDLGPVHCRLQLRGEQVSAMFWAERETTASLFQENLGRLESGLRQEGLMPRRLHCQTGQPPLPTPRRHEILDERA